MRAPPHPRGWTQVRGRAECDPAGSPAPAGMDPPPGHSPLRRWGLPRTRGDGPDLQSQTVSLEMAPPHPRGWIQGRQQSRKMATGSPAPAGMDPNFGRQSEIGAWLPRTRGDGPWPANQKAPADLAPPHPRGWTLASAGDHRPDRGSPTPAGMDPKAPLEPARGVRLPRTRGDGPTLGMGSLDLEVTPPHPRGWTRVQDQGRAGGVGLPRTRGDGPLFVINFGTNDAAPPHPRGWTPVGLLEILVRTGSPAPAGMDPIAAGTNLLTGRLSRTRGDRPYGQITLSQASTAPPHPRGWTQRRRRQGSVCIGSPAPAGMDHRPDTGRCSRSWLPRTPGDGPRAR